MSKKVIVYSLENNRTIPSFIEDGGYFAIGDDIVGISSSDSFQSATQLSRAELLAWAVNAHKDANGNYYPVRWPRAEGNYTDEMVAQIVDDFLNSRGMADYA